MALATGIYSNALTGEWGAQESAGGCNGGRSRDKGPRADRRQTAAGTRLA